MTQNTNKTAAATRRNFAFGAALAGLAATATRAGAQSTTANPDIAILNYALTLEHLEATFYTQGLARFQASDFMNASFAGILGSGTVMGVYNNLLRIRDHEVAHVDAIRQVITALGGTPVLACNYNFPYNTPEQFLQLAQTLENLGVKAYNGALAMLNAMQLKAAGASIATVEARHASYLNLVNGMIPFPNAFDETATMNEVLAQATPLITSCPTPPGQTVTTRAVLLPKDTVTASRTLMLDARQSVSGNGQALSYNVRLISGNASISQGNTATPIVTFNGYGTYVFELTVTDSAGVTATDRITVRYVGV